MRAWEFISEEIALPELNQVETLVSRLYQQLGIDIKFSRHFIDRLNDPRNGKPITIDELYKLFIDEYKEHGREIAELDDNTQAVFKDLATKLNLPFVVRDRGRKTEVIAKSVMRKDNYATTSPVYTVEENLTAKLSNQ